MKLKFSYLASAIAILLVLFSTVGCSSDANKSNSSKLTKVSFWYQQTGAEEKAMLDLVQKFNKEHENIQVDAQYAPGTGAARTLPEKLMSAIGGGDPPDVAYVDSHVIAQYGSKNALEDLSDYAAKYKIEKSQFIDAFWEQNTWQDGLYGLPLFTDIRFLYWNKDLFKEAGLDPESPPKSIDELDQYAEKLTKIDDKGNIVQAGFIPWIDAGGQGLWPWAFGTDFVDSNGELVVDRPETIAALDWMQSYAEKYGGVQLNSFVNSVQQGQSPFGAGKVGIVAGGSWDIPQWSESAPDLNYGFAPIPTIDGNITTWSGGGSIVIPKGAKHPDQAFEFISWLIQPENMMVWDQAAGHYPVQKSNISKLGTPENIIVSELADELAKELLPITHTRPASPKFPQMWEGIKKAIIDVSTDTSDSPEEMMKNLQKELNKSE